MAASFHFARREQREKREEKRAGERKTEIGGWIRRCLHGGSLYPHGTVGGEGMENGGIYGQERDEAEKWMKEEKTRGC